MKVAGFLQGNWGPWRESFLAEFLEAEQEFTAAQLGQRAGLP